MQTINSDSGNRKFCVIHVIYFSSMETAINFLLVFSLLRSWSFITWGRGRFIFLGDHYKNFQFLVLGHHLRIVTGGGSLINLMKVVQSSNY